jgi:DNA-binding MarR family transcriptional regulator
LSVKAAPDEATSLWERPGFLVRRLHQISVAIFVDEMGDLDITPVQFGALSVVAANPGIDQSALAGNLGIDRANVADVVARLSSAGHVTRKASVTDRRVKNIYMTTSGHEHLAEANRRFSKVHRRLLDPLSPTERDTFLKLLMRLIEQNNGLGRAVLNLERRGKSSN